MKRISRIQFEIPRLKASIEIYKEYSENEENGCEEYEWLIEALHEREHSSKVKELLMRTYRETPVSRTDLDYAKEANKTLTKLLEAEGLGFTSEITYE